MKSKKILILFLIFLISIFPIEKTLAWNGIDWFIDRLKDIKNILGNFGEWIIEKIKAIKDCVTNPVFCGLALFVHAITWIFHQFFWHLNLYLIAPMVNFVSDLNPFEGEGNISPVTVMWNIFKNFAYILLVFSALAAGYEWLLGEDAAAKKLIFNIIIVALLISFTFVLVREAFLVIKGIEDGLVGNIKEVGLGSFVVTSLWQGDPFAMIKDISENLVDDVGFRYVFEAVGYIFIIVFDMLIFILLLIFIFLFVVRYFMMIFLAGTSSVAVATLTFPEFKGALGRAMSGFRVFDTWFEYFIRWLLVIPIFVFLVIFGNILKENVLDKLATTDISDISVVDSDSETESSLKKTFEFFLLFVVIGGWYVMSMIIANRVSRGVSKLAQVIATAILLAVGGLAAKGVLTATQGRVGNILSSTGKKIEEGVGVGGVLGWRSWVGQKIGKPTREIGEKLMERRYGLEAESVKAKIGTIDEELRRETDPTKIQNLTSQLAQLTQRYQNVPYVLKSINEAIGRMLPSSFGKIAANPDALQAIANPSVPQETREKVIDKIERLGRVDLRNMITNTQWLRILGSLSPDIAEAIINKIGKELTEIDAIEAVSKDDVRDFISRLPKTDNFRRTFNKITKGFIEALLEKNFENISNAMAGWDKDIWLRPENIKTIDTILNSYNLTDDEKKAIILSTLRKTENRGAVIRGALKESPGGPLRTVLARLTDEERGEIKRFLTPQEQAVLNSLLRPQL